MKTELNTKTNGMILVLALVIMGVILVLVAYFLQFIGLLSVNLAILNFLPIPALDGGRILFLAIEKVKGSRVNPRIENLAHTIGFALLILLMVLVTYKDVVRIL